METIKLKKRWPLNEETVDTENILRALSLNTVCEEASCPNKGECFSKRKLTFLILGYVCTRSCGFCGVSKGVPQAPDTEEPDRIAMAVEKLGLKEVVITSVTRDDLPDGGASYFRDAVKAIKNLNRDVVVEVLTPDFRGYISSLEVVLQGEPDIFGHNIETVPRLYHRIRPGADYSCSLEVLKFSSSFPGIRTKSGIMVGIGEKAGEIEKVLEDLKEYGADIVTIGQYLRPSRSEVPVIEYISDELFKYYGEYGKRLGLEVHAGTFIRSSYVSNEI